MAPTNEQARNAKIKAASAGSKQPKAHTVRYLKNQQSQLIEPGRSLLLLRGVRCPDAMATILKDLRSLKSPKAKLLTKNNMITPFQDESGNLSIEFLCTKNDCSLFALASSNKKRPNNLVIGRTFDHHVLDMVELGVLRYKSLSDYKSAPKKRIGSKPLMVFTGDKWHLDEEFRRLQNLLIDFYRGEPVEKIVLSGLDHVMCFTVSDQQMADSSVGVVHMRTFFVKLKKHPGGGTTPVPYLTPCGPDMDFRLRRKQFASNDVWKLAMKQPKAAKAKKVKNQTTNLFGETIGRLHLEKQDIDKLQGKRSKALRIAGKIDAEEEKKVVEAELEKEKQQMGKEFKQIYGFDEKDVS